MAKLKHTQTAEAVPTAAAETPKAEKKVKAPVVIPDANGKECFEGTVGGKKWLFDAGNGETLLELVVGTPHADQAQAIGRTLIPRSKATKYALNLLFRNWRTARPAKAETPAAQEPVAA